jgi:hypothetical protein
MVMCRKPVCGYILVSNHLPLPDIYSDHDSQYPRPSSARVQIEWRDCAYIDSEQECILPYSTDFTCTLHQGCFIEALYKYISFDCQISTLLNFCLNWFISSYISFSSFFNPPISVFIKYLYVTNLDRWPLNLSGVTLLTAAAAPEGQRYNTRCIPFLPNLNHDLSSSYIEVRNP